MIVKTLVRPNRYYDSLVLMRISSQLLNAPGVVDATVMMGTEQNKHSIGNALLVSPEVEAAGPTDLFLVVAAATEADADAALALGEQILVSGRGGPTLGSDAPVATLDAALRQQPASNLAVISIPGPYVKREALKALDAGLNLLIFSDNVPIEDEIELKRVGEEKGLMVMGPDCGTAIIGGAALAFANAVCQGPIGIVGASGTGLQEVSCLIDRLGQGVSHAIGTGTHDVDEAVGGSAMIQGLRRLEADASTEAIVIVSKPPAPMVMEAVLTAAAACTKPVVVNFLGGDQKIIKNLGSIPARTLEDAAVKAVAAVCGESAGSIRRRLLAGVGDLDGLAVKARADLGPEQKYVRGLFAGGTYTSEAAMILFDLLGSVYTNVGYGSATRLEDPHESVGHTCVDLGDDIFTVGKPHPMLEPSLRRERILAEAADPETAVILLDVPIGYGSHHDPAGELVKYLLEAQDVLKQAGRAVPMVASVCGVETDPQGLTFQAQKLLDAGVVVMPSNAQACALAAKIVAGLD